MNKKISEILKASLFVGTLDILGAIIYFYINTGGKDVSIVLKYIASAVYGKGAFAGGGEMVILGLLLHYVIAFIFTSLLYWLFPKMPPFFKNKVVAGIVYGLLIWAVMNLIVVPLSRIGSRPFTAMNMII